MLTIAETARAAGAAAVLALTVAAATTAIAQTPGQTPGQAQPQAKPPAAPSTVVARVDGQPITEADITLAEEEIGAQLNGYPPNVRRKVIIEFLIENQLFAKAAADGKLSGTDAYKQRMSYWSRRMLRDTYFEDTLRKTITDADARKFYDQKIASLKGGTEVKASHILVPTEDKAKEIFEQIAHGADFAEMARKHSGDPGSKTNGGSLGYFGKGRMVPEFEAAAFQLKVGEVSLPVKSKFGWHLIKVEDRRERKPPPFEAIKDRIIAALMRDKARETGSKLRETAKIEYVGEKPRLNLTPAPAPAAPK